MTRSTLSYLQLLALLVTATQGAPSKPCTTNLSPELMEKVPHLHKDIRLFRQAVCANDQKMDQYAQDVDEIVADILSWRSLTYSRTKQDFEEEKKLMVQLFDRAYKESLTGGRRPVGIGISPKGEIVINGPKMLKAETAINAYKTCVNKYEGQTHVSQVQNDLYNGIASGTVKTVEKLQGYRARIISAGRADFAGMNAHRMQCFMDTTKKENAIAEVSSTKCFPKIMKLEWKESMKEEENGYKIIEENLQQEKIKLREWKVRQTEVVQNVFDDLLKRKSQKDILESQENRIYALQVTAGIQEDDAKRPKNLFNIGDFREEPEKVTEMMQYYFECVGGLRSHANIPKPQCSRDVGVELKHKMPHFSGNKRADRSIFEYFWRKHIIGIILDNANSIETSLDCFVKTERKFVY